VNLPFNHLRRIVLMASLALVPCAIAQNVSVRGDIEVTNQRERGASVEQSNVVVWLTPLSAAPRWRETDRRDFTLLQRNKTFSPHLLVVPVGADVKFPNHDPVFHNVFSLFEGKRFDLGLYEAGSSRTTRFDRPGVSYIFCNIHPEMGAVVIALRTPYYAVSDGNGKLAIADVPAGRYTLHVWHEAAPSDALNQLEREVTISEEAHSLGTIRLTLPQIQSVAHKNKYGQDYPKPPSGLYEQR
jgi:plastocyanin